ncbi:MAG: hypothetical protein CMP10_07070 [Zetaproteobacteria bacterium]|nr:hypothetical protein [Pseudobdellovibrionaceae bacterium]|tara:strand:- start:1379 stop:1741 length:363 start_codon:yes stop_codon:yes gene_type:complete
MAKILIVDDSSTIILQLEHFLEGAGYEVVVARDGTEGIEKLEEHDNIDLVLSDINMPKMNGFEMVKEMTTKKNVKVFMLSTEGDSRMIKKAKEAGAKGYIIKPFDHDELLRIVGEATKPA